jgi:hypothetical protein
VGFGSSGDVDNDVLKEGALDGVPRARCERARENDAGVRICSIESTISESNGESVRNIRSEESRNEQKVNEIRVLLPIYTN